MFQEMINGSIAVLTKPAVSTFEEHEKDNLTWALIYSVIAGVINAIVAAIGAVLGLGANAAAGNITGADAAVGGAGIFFAIFAAIFGTVLGLLISWGITYGLGRAFGGTGSFGELAWGLSLFGAPLTVANGILGLIPVVGAIAALALGIYGLYLTYLAIQSGMNLPSQKALYVILVLFLIGLVLFCFIFGAAALAIIGLGAANGEFAP